MKAAVLIAGHTAPGQLLQIEDVDRPEPGAGHVLLRVLACGVCRTDLHIAEGDLPPLQPKLIPGHQIVGEVAGGATAELPLGSRVGVSWIGGVDGKCWYLRPRDGEPVRSAYVYRVHREWRLCRVRAGARRLLLSAACRPG